MHQELASSKNAEVVQLIKDYVLHEQAPGFAILVKGPWGSGKTWFVKNAVNELADTSHRIIYVSLYGIDSTSRIDDAIFAELHPILSSKKARLLAKVGKGFLKGTLKFDFDDDDKADGTIQFSPPELTSSDLTAEHTETTFIFDDLERCPIDTTVTLGYINHLVESLSCKVILIANEIAITSQEAQTDGEESKSEKKRKPGYSEIKEKLVGVTVSIRAELDLATQTFISKIQDEATKQLLSERIDVIRDIYQECQYENLRHLKHAFFDLERLCGKLTKDILDHSGLITELLRQFLTLYIEHKAGSLRQGDISYLANHVKLLVKKHSNQELNSAENRADAFWSRHPHLDLERFLLRPELWAQIIEDGIWDPELVNESLRNSRFFMHGDAPEWLRLWHMQDLPDEEVAELLELVIRKFDNREFLEEGPFKHVIGELLYLSNAGVHDPQTSEVVDAAKSYIDDICSSGQILEMGVHNESTWHDTGHAGLAYMCRDAPAFCEIGKYLTEKAKEARRASYPQIAQGLLEMLETDPENFGHAISRHNGHHGEYFKEAVLPYIDADRFVETLLKSPSPSRRRTAISLKERYELATSYPELKDESDWLDEVSRLLSAHSQAEKGVLSAYYLGHLATQLSDIAANMKPQGAEDADDSKHSKEDRTS